MFLEKIFRFQLIQIRVSETFVFLIKIVRRENAAVLVIIGQTLQTWYQSGRRTLLYVEMGDNLVPYNANFSIVVHTR